MAVLQLTYELRPKWKNNNNKNNNKNKTQIAVSRSDPLQGSDKKKSATAVHQAKIFGHITLSSQHLLILTKVYKIILSA